MAFTHQNSSPAGQNDGFWNEETHPSNENHDEPDMANALLPGSMSGHVDVNHFSNYGSQGFKHPGDLVRHVQEQHAQHKLLCPINGCHLGVPGKDLKRRYRLVKHLMAPSHTRARGHGLQRNEAERRADAVVDAVKAQRAAAAYALLADAGIVMPSGRNHIRLGSAAVAAADNDNTIHGFTEPWPTLPTMEDAVVPLMDNAVGPLLPLALKETPLHPVDAAASSAYDTTMAGDDGGMTWNSFTGVRSQGTFSAAGRSVLQADGTEPVDGGALQDTFSWGAFLISFDAQESPMNSDDTTHTMSMNNNSVDDTDADA